MATRSNAHAKELTLHWAEKIAIHLVFGMLIWDYELNKQLLCNNGQVKQVSSKFLPFTNWV